ncbi:MAG: GNAT family N-acetyltransferase [Alphaproteobacteria bacterium]|nr:GNAT family N-acetyltransferase [Alphaproteobacteria bacterium]
MLNASETGSAQRPVLRFEVIGTVEEFDALRPEWDKLIAAVGNPNHVFLQHSWLSHWAHCFVSPDGPQLQVVVARADGRVAAIWPLVREKQFGMRILTWMGLPVSQYCDVLVEDGPWREDFIKAGLHFIKRSLGGDLFIARMVREDGLVAKALTQTGARLVGTEHAASVDPGGLQTLADLDKRLGRSTAKSRRRRRKQLSKEGAPRYSVHREGDEAMRAVDHALTFKEEWFAKHGIISQAYSDERFGAFWRRVAASKDQRVGLRAGVLELDGRPIAVELGLRFKGRHHAHVGAFSLDYEHTSPGLSQLEAQILECAADGVGEYDLLAPLSDYKTKLADKTTAVNDYVLPVSSFGHAGNALGLTSATSVAKTVFKSLPVGVRKAIKAAIN